MNTGVFYNRRVRQGSTIVLLLLAIAAMFPSGHPLLIWWAAQAEWVALGYIMLAIVLLVLNRTRLMFVCLGCSAAICLFYNETRGIARWPASPPAGEVTAPDKNKPVTDEFAPPAQ